jgi:hypothetical protein
MVPRKIAVDAWLGHYAFFAAIPATMATHGQSKDFDLWLI